MSFNFEDVINLFSIIQYENCIIKKYALILSIYVRVIEFQKPFDQFAMVLENINYTFICIILSIFVCIFLEVLYLIVNEHGFLYIRLNTQSVNSALTALITVKVVIYTWKTTCPGDFYTCSRQKKNSYI